MIFLPLLLTLLFFPEAYAQEFERDTPRHSSYHFVTSRQGHSPVVWRYGGDQDRNLYSRGFSITNFGPNDIIWDPPVDFLNTPSREYFFVSDDFSRRDTYLWVTDYNGSGRTSDFFESVFVFLPRLHPYRVTEKGEELEVTLTTGENIYFTAKYRTLATPLLVEAPLDLHPDRELRGFIDLKYTGAGIIIRSDAKGRDPRLSPSVKIIKGELSCELPGHFFWTQEDHPKFKFTHDRDVYELIKIECPHVL